MEISLPTERCCPEFARFDLSDRKFDIPNHKFPIMMEITITIKATTYRNVPT
jgi:hypothetical protein